MSIVIKSTTPVRQAQPDLPYHESLGVRATADALSDRVQRAQCHQMRVGPNESVKVHLQGAHSGFLLYNVAVSDDLGLLCHYVRVDQAGRTAVIVDNQAPAERDVTVSWL